MTGFDWWMAGCMLLIVVASLGESWCLRQVISGMTDDCRKWRRRALHYHEHAMGERERAEELEALHLEALDGWADEIDEVERMKGGMQ